CMRAGRLVVASCFLAASVLSVASGATASSPSRRAYAAPWAHPVSFKPLHGWQPGQSGTTHGLYGGPLESPAWIAQGVRYTSPATADPPNATLAHLPANAIIVWTVIASPFQNDRPLRLSLRNARHLACCDGPVTVVGGVDELTGYGKSRAYSVIIR